MNAYLSATSPASGPGSVSLASPPEPSLPPSLPVVSERSSPRVRLWRPEDLLYSELMHSELVDLRLAPHEHLNWTISWITEGANEFRCADQHFTAPAGSVCVVNPGEIHTGGGRRVVCWSLMPSAALLELAFPGIDPGALRAPRTVVRDAAAVAAVRHLFETFLGEGTRLQRQEAAIRALHAILERAPVAPHAPNRSSRSQALVARATDYLMENLHRQVSLEELGAVVGVSPFQVCRVFATRVGIAPGAFVRSRRIARAQQLIRTGRDLSSVAAACGFSDQAHMTRLFRAVIGCTPAQWRGAK